MKQRITSLHERFKPKLRPPKKPIYYDYAIVCKNHGTDTPYCIFAEDTEQAKRLLNHKGFRACWIFQRSVHDPRSTSWRFLSRQHTRIVNYKSDIDGNSFTFTEYDQFSRFTDEYRFPTLPEMTFSDFADIV